jgi:hypothetical protein
VNNRLVEANGKEEVFSNLLRTDGFSADVIIYKPAIKPFDSSDLHYMIEDLHGALLHNEDNIENFSLTAIDPGRTSIFTAASGDERGGYEIRRCTRKEYCHI